MKDKGTDEKAPTESQATLFEEIKDALLKSILLIWKGFTMVVFIYILVVCVVLYSTELKMEIIFANRITHIGAVNYSDCHSFGLIKCENLYIEGSAGKIGAWFISPPSKYNVVRDAYFLYLHGNSYSRALDHRVELYKRLSKMGYHILAIDYRGYGDSDGWPTELGLVEDAKDGYRWLKTKAHGNPIYIWGHSLGSAVGVQLGAWLNAEKELLNGVFLESPFNNMTDGIMYNAFFPPIPALEAYLDDMKDVFKSTYWIQKVQSPIQIYHDVSDQMLNIVLGRKLYLHAKEVGTSNVNMIEFDEKLYHNNIYAAKYLKNFVMEFVRNTS